jgi:hypothetical protein
MKHRVTPRTKHTIIIWLEAIYTTPLHLFEVVHLAQWHHPNLFQSRALSIGVRQTPHPRIKQTRIHASTPGAKPLYKMVITLSDSSTATRASASTVRTSHEAAAGHADQLSGVPSAPGPFETRDEGPTDRAHCLTRSLLA